MGKVLNWSTVCYAILLVFPLEAQEISQFRDHILYYGTPQRDVKSMRLQVFEGPMLYAEEPGYTTFQFSSKGQLKRIVELGIKDTNPKIFNFQYLNEQEINWQKTHLGKKILVGKIVLEKEGKRLLKLSNYEEDELVEVSEYQYQDGGVVKEVIQNHTGNTLKIIRTYQDGQLRTVEHYNGIDGQLETTQQYSYVGDTAKIVLYDPSGKQLVGSDMRLVRRNNESGDWIELERQFRLPYGQRYLLGRRIQYADDPEPLSPASFTPGNWYSFLFKPNILFCEFNEDGTYDLGFQSMIWDYGTYQIKKKKLSLQSSIHGRKGVFKVSPENQLMAFTPINDPDQFFYPFMMRLEGEEDLGGKIDPEIYNEFLRTYMRLLFGD